MNQANALGIVSQTCMKCSGGYVDFHNTGLYCAWQQGFPCAVIDIEKAIHADKRQDVIERITLDRVGKWARIRGLPDHDAVSEILALSPAADDSGAIGMAPPVVATVTIEEQISGDRFQPQNVVSDEEAEKDPAIPEEKPKKKTKQG